MLSREKYDICIQEEGYHLFELYGYAVAALLKKDFPLFQTRAFRKALAYGLNIGALNQKLGIQSPATMNRYAYGYNSPAFELPLIQQVFTGKTDEKLVLSLLEKQKELTFNPNTLLFDRSTADSETLTARLYEYVRFCDQVREKVQ